MWTYSIPPTAGTTATSKRTGGRISPVLPVLDAGLGSTEETQEKEESIHSEVQVVKQQLEAHPNLHGRETTAQNVGRYSWDDTTVW